MEPSPEELSRHNAREWAIVLLTAAVILGAATLGVLALRNALTPSSEAISVVGIGKSVKGTQFDYTVVTVSRQPSIGAARARGNYLIVFVTLTNRGTDRATLTPAAFRLVDGGGTQYSALSEADAVYRRAENPTAPLIWTTSYPAGQEASTPIVFDVDAALRGVQLMILEVPNVRVRLD